MSNPIFGYLDRRTSDSRLDSRFSSLIKMRILNINISNRQFFQIIFHIILWTVWIGFPIVNAGDHERFLQYHIALIPVTLTHIPLFLLNTEWLIPRLLRKKGIPAYLISLILLMVFFATLQLFMKDWVIPEHLRFRHFDLFWAIVPVCFVTAISTGYGFIMYLIDQEKARQDEQQERLKSELSFLRSQISPHFIFNILNSLVYLIRSQSDLAESVTIKLSELMRYMLYTSSEEQVPLESELDYLKNYVELQRVRFEEDVEIKLQVDGQAGGQMIEPMLLIPFVENAFKHGVGMISEPVIDIFLEFDKKKLFFSISNKIAPELPEEKDSSSGIGLRNVKRRLELLYPNSHQLEISEETDWFTIELSLEFDEER